MTWDDRKRQIVLVYRGFRFLWEICKLIRTAITGKNAPVKPGDLVRVRRNVPQYELREGSIGLVTQYRFGFVNVLQDDGTMAHNVPALVEPPFIKKLEEE